MINFKELEKELRFSTSRAGGSGGQHVNKVETKVTLYFDIKESRFLSLADKNKLHLKLRNRINKEGVLVVSSEATRSQHKNKEEVLRLWRNALNNALRIQKKRVKTRVPEKANEKRLIKKKMKSERKKFRRKPGLEW